MADGDSTRQLSGGRPPRPPAISRTIRRLTANRVQLFAAVVKRAPARPRKSRSSADGSFCCPELIQTLARGPVGPRLALHRPPWVLLATEAPGHARQRVRLWLRPSQLPPVDRRGHRRTALGPHRVRRHRRLPPAVATGVDEQPSRPLGLVALDRQPLGVAVGQQRGGVGGQRAHLVEAGARPQRRHHVEPLGPGGLHERDQAQLLEQVADPPCGVADALHRAVVRRVEVEHHPVRLLEMGDPPGRGVQRHRAEVGQVGERVGVVAARVLDAAAALARDRGAPHPVGEVLRRLLLEEALAVDPLREALQAQRPVLDVGEHGVGHLPVVADQVALGDAVAREQHLVGVGNLDLGHVHLGSPWPAWPFWLVSGASQRRNQSAASAATRSSAPGSSKRWVASGTISSRCSTPSCSAAERSRTSDGPARSGRPPRDTTAAICSGRSAATTSAAAAPVLAPNNPIGRAAVLGSPASQSIAAINRPVSRAMSKRSSARSRSTASSSSVSRSSSSVARPACPSAAATWRLRGLCLPLPDPCANSTTPRAPSGTARSPARRAVPAGTVTLVRTLIASLPGPPLYPGGSPPPLVC